MGMYTELLLKCAIKGSIPEKEMEIIKALFNKEQEVDPELVKDLPNHPFFKCERWSFIGNSSSYYHHPKVFNDLEKGLGNYYLFSRSDLKNYEDEILHFLDWFSPFVQEEEGQCVGWSWYEEALEPTLLIFNGNKIEKSK